MARRRSNESDYRRCGVRSVDEDFVVACMSLQGHVNRTDIKLSDITNSKHLSHIEKHIELALARSLALSKLLCE